MLATCFAKIQRNIIYSSLLSSNCFFLGSDLHRLIGGITCGLTIVKTSNHVIHEVMPSRSINFFLIVNLQVIKVKLPDFEDTKSEADMTPEEIRSKLKERGMQPPRPWIERPFYISSTGGVFEPYVPPEGDGKISPITVHVSINRI